MRTLTTFFALCVFACTTATVLLAVPRRQFGVVNSSPITFSRFNNAAAAEKARGLAFVITVHNERTARPLGRLLRTLWRPEDTFVVHVDVRADSVTRFILGATEELRLSNVHVVSWRANFYPKNEMVETSVDMIQYALEHASEPWTHVVQLTGDSYPLQAPFVIRKLFALQPNKTWIDSNVYTHKNKRVLKCHGREQFWLVRPDRLRHGQSHWALTRDFAHFVVHSQLARNLLVWVDCGEFQDEVFFQTLFYNSPWSVKTPDDRLMYAVWGSRQDTRPPKMNDMPAAAAAASRKPRSELVSTTLAPIAFKFGFLFARKVTNHTMQAFIESLWVSNPSPYQPFLLDQ